MSEGTTTLSAADLLAGQLALELSDGQVEHLCTAHGLKRPLRLRGAATVAPTVEPEAIARLAALGIEADGELAPWFRALWRTIAASPVLVIVDRVVGDTSYRWAYPVDRGSFCEQAETDAGYLWLFASHLHLLPRLLLTAGLLRSADTDDAARLDPLATATAWTTRLSVHRRGMPRSAVRSLALRVDTTAGATGGATGPDAAGGAFSGRIERLHRAGPPQPCSPREALDAVTALVRGLARP